jgi:hypothetical protein
MKTCATCRLEKPKSDFHKLSRSRDGLGYRCKECACKASSEFKKANAEKVTAYAKAYRDNHKAYFSAKAREFRERNPEWQNEWNRNNRDRARAIALKTYYANPVRARKNEASRRAAKLKAIPAWADHQSISDVYAEARYFQMTVDHIVPLRSNLVCGLHVWDNLQLLSRTENLAKNNRHWPDMPA